jgi:hypothetical protein
MLPDHVALAAHDFRRQAARAIEILACGNLSTVIEINRTASTVLPNFSA